MCQLLKKTRTNLFLYKTVQHFKNKFNDIHSLKMEFLYTTNEVIIKKGLYQKFIVEKSEAYLGPYQTSLMEGFSKIINSF